MSAVHLYCIKANLFGAPCPLGVSLHQRLDLLYAQLSGYLSDDGIGNRRWRYRLLTTDTEGEGLAPGVVQLHSDLGTSGVDALHKAAEPGLESIIPDAQLVGEPLTQGIDSRHLHNDEPEASPRSGLKVFDEPVRYRPIGCAKAGPHGWHHQSVLQFHLSNFNRLE
ncbi:hypothetical protein ES703_21424 [subsurface metagenome]